MHLAYKRLDNFFDHNKQHCGSKKDNKIEKQSNKELFYFASFHKGNMRM